jgi:uncharacterized protein (TIGR03118 family)
MFSALSDFRLQYHSVAAFALCPLCLAFQKGEKTMTSECSLKYFSRSAASLLLMASVLAWLATPASAQYTVTNLVSNQNAIGSNPADPDLVNAWGVTSLAASPFWVSDNGTGKSTLYNSLGQKQGLVVTIPSASGTGQGSPTGVIGNTTGHSFVVSLTEGNATKSGKALFLFATQDGTISGWSPGVLPTTAVIAINRSGLGASYTALALFTNNLGNSFLYAPNNTDGGGIDVFDGGFNYLGTVSDPQIPRSFAPYGARVIDDRLWVTFGGTNKANSGFVDVFQINSNGTLNKLFEANGPLHSPWGLALAPPNFGPFSNAVLIANNIKDGEINAFDPANGNFLGHLADGNGRPITINQLWGLDFGKGAGANGAPSELFFTAGPDDYANGLFGVITVTP